MRISHATSAHATTKHHDRRRPIRLHVAGLDVQLSQAEALALADQLVDAVERIKR